MRGHAEQAFALNQGFAHEPEFIVFKVAQAAVNELCAGRRRVAGKILCLNQKHRKPAPGGIARDPSAVDPAANDQ